MQSFFSTKYQQVPEDSPKAESSYKQPEPAQFVIEKRSCTDIPCGIIFLACVAFSGWIVSYALKNGDPRKVYHGIDYKGRLCGVDLPYEPYVYWCSLEGGGLNNWDVSPVTKLDFHHPICVEYCPTSPVTQSQCYDPKTGGTRVVTDYATHPVGHHFCFPQLTSMQNTVNMKFSQHPVERFIPMAVEMIRKAWPVLLGVFFFAIVLSFAFMLLLECFAGVLLWCATLTLILCPAVTGGCLIYAYYHEGIDGMPGSGDGQTDLLWGVILLFLSAFFLLVVCCMGSAIKRAIDVVQCAAACIFHCRSILLEPLNNIIARAILWCLMLYSFACLLGCGTVRASKIYRTFSFSTEEGVYIVFSVIMMIWLNEFCNAMSQYVVSWATSKWYFTEDKAKVESCLLWKAYTSGFFLHLGSLALGSFLIALTRPVRLFFVILMAAGEITGNDICACCTKACFCCWGCFETWLVHVCKYAYIDMAMTGKTFCSAGHNACDIMKKQDKSVLSLAGAAWLFTVTGLLSVSALGAYFTHLMISNIDTFSEPLSRFYIQDPLVFDVLAGILSFVVALCFMLVFDSAADTCLLCYMYDKKEQEDNPVPKAEEPEKPPTQSVFMSYFSQPPQQAARAPTVKRPVYCHSALQTLVTQKN